MTSQLDELLAQWARDQQLTAGEARVVRETVLGAESELDADWLWRLLRPVTDLLEGPHRLYDRVEVPYLRLA
jgi:hypothetical protein